MSLLRRTNFYIRCQAIVDDLHENVAKGHFMDEPECKSRYGKSDYYGLLHELHMMNADMDYKVMTPAMEWLHHSQYFQHKATQERIFYLMFWISVISAAVAIISATYTIFSSTKNSV